MEDFAKMDNGLAKSQTDIGESSNLAQIAQTYACNFTDSKYADYTCILSVLAQVAIDNAKRRFDIDLTKEIQRIKKDMDIKTNKYPNFWSVIKKNFPKKNINRALVCPMNYLYDLELNKFRSGESTLPMEHFFQKFDLDENRIKCKKVEELIQKFSLELFSYNTSETDSETKKEDYLLLRSDFNDLIADIRKTYISRNYLGLMSWLIDRAFMITPNIRSNNKTIKSTIKTNKSMLLKVLYEVNSDALLKCFSKNLYTEILLNE